MDHTPWESAATGADLIERQHARAAGRRTTLRLTFDHGRPSRVT